MMSDIPEVSLPLTEETVVTYLQEHVDFFVDHPSLLAELTLPHSSGGTVSLVERQVKVLRDRNYDMHDRLKVIMDNARSNDQLFEKTRRLILALLEAQDINDLVDALMQGLINDFCIPYTTLLLFAEPFFEAELSIKSNVILAPISLSKQVLGTIITNNRTVCGQLDTQEQAFIFQENASQIGSTAITPIANGADLSGILAIGSSDPDYYQPGMNTLFLSYIGDVVGRLLPNYQSSDHSAS